MLVSERGSAAAAKCPPRACFGAIPTGSSLVEAKVGTFYRDPGDGLGPNGTPAVFAMAIGQIEWLRRRAKADVATIASASNRRMVHRRTTESSGAPGDANNGARSKSQLVSACRCHTSTERASSDRRRRRPRMAHYAFCVSPLSWK